MVCGLSVVVCTMLFNGSLLVICFRVVGVLLFVDCVVLSVVCVLFVVCRVFSLIPVFVFRTFLLFGVCVVVVGVVAVCWFSLY